MSPAWSPELADRIREQLAGRDVVEKPMFGSLCFLVDGALCVCASAGAMLARLSERDRDAALEAGLGRPMVMRGRDARHYAYLDEEVLQDEDVFRDWMGRALAFSRSLTAGRTTVPRMKLDPALLEILACPACRSALRADETAEELVCTGCGLAYPVRDDIPVLLVDEARSPA